MFNIVNWDSVTLKYANKTSVGILLMSILFYAWQMSWVDNATAGAIGTAIGAFTGIAFQERFPRVFADNPVTAQASGETK